MAKSTGADLTRSVEDYLKAIYTLTERGVAASTNRIAELLGLSAASVSGMVKRLAGARLVRHLPYRGVTLTADGERAALRMLRRHRIIESYLVSRLGYTWDNVHDEAERLEHAVSEDLVGRMSRALGDPIVDPHGDPIPREDGRIETLAAASALPDVEVGSTVTIARVDSTSGDRLRWLAEAGLVPGAVVTVLEHQPFDGPITVRLGRGRRVVGAELARQVHCVSGVNA